MNDLIISVDLHGSMVVLGISCFKGSGSSSRNIIMVWTIPTSVVCQLEDTPKIVYLVSPICSKASLVVLLTV